ncbi:MFS transporter, partial [Sphingobium phenoxybenzoativorans]|uniref:MFS transporter n=1 Tax=Sphingobium phenoxybenzoativorans TaxID=1592790 RepID=UPI001495B3C6
MRRSPLSRKSDARLPVGPALMRAGPTAGRGEKLIVIALVFAGFAAGYACTYAAVSTTFILPLTKAFGWGRLVPAFMYLSAMLGVVSASMLLGPVIQRVGEARVTALSGLCLAIIISSHALLGGSVPVAIGLAYLAGLLGAGTGVGLYVSLMPRWFDADLGRALGFAVMGQSFGSAIMPAISAGVIAVYGWRTAYLVLAGIALVVTLIVAAILSVLLAKLKRETAGTVTVDGIDLREARRMPIYRLLQASAFLQAFAMFGVSFHIFPIYADLGLDWAVLPKVTVALAAGLAIGRVVSGVLLDFVE